MHAASSVLEYEAEAIFPYFFRPVLKTFSTTAGDKTEVLPDAASQEYAVVKRKLAQLDRRLPCV